MYYTIKKFVSFLACFSTFLAQAFCFPNEETNGSDFSFANWKKNNIFASAHFNLAEYFNCLWQKHPEYIKIIHIRDLRDVCVSCTFFQSEEIEKEIGTSCFAEKLLFVLSLENKPCNYILRIKKYAEIAAEWIKDPLAVVCRFENLIGEKGGESLISQQEQITAIAKSLNINLDRSKLDWITDNLFGIRSGPSLPSTYREGKIGSWRKFFNAEHKKAFEEHLGEIQLHLGYDLFDDEKNFLANPANDNLLIWEKGK